MFNSFEICSRWKEKNSVFNLFYLCVFAPHHSTQREHLAVGVLDKAAWPPGRRTVNLSLNHVSSTKFMRSVNSPYIRGLEESFRQFQVSRRLRKGEFLPVCCCIGDAVLMVG